jgi:small subunit ribosomal protein S35
MYSLKYSFQVIKSTSSCFDGLKLCRILIGHPSASLSNVAAVDSNEKFRVLDLKKKRAVNERRKPAKKPLTLPPRSESMPIDQDWVSIWPGPRSFHPATVPLPVRQGYPVKDGEAPPGKFGNAELMKIPNFLHLTPPAIERHCQAIKKFCTSWPAALQTDEACEKAFPIEVATSDYCYSSPSIRNPLSRIVTLKVKFSSLKLDAHAKDKFLRLVAERYDPATDTVTIMTDRCPTKKQNKEYAQFLLAALYHESWKIEPWEKEKSAEDMEHYDWYTSASRASIDQLTARKLDVDQKHVQNYSQVVTSLIDEGEDIQAINKYKEWTKKLLSLPDPVL